MKKVMCVLLVTLIFVFSFICLVSIVVGSIVVGIWGLITLLGR